MGGTMQSGLIHDAALDSWERKPQAYKDYYMGAFPSGLSYEDLMQFPNPMLRPLREGEERGMYGMPKGDYTPMDYDQWRAMQAALGYMKPGGSGGGTTPPPTTPPTTPQNPFPAILPGQLQDPFATGGTGTTPGGTLSPFGFPYPYTPQTPYQPYQFSTGQAYGMNPLQLFGGDMIRSQNLFNTIPASPVLAQK